MKNLPGGDRYTNTGAELLGAMAAAILVAVFEGKLAVPVLARAVVRWTGNRA
jgi:hypothetical protein